MNKETNMTGPLLKTATKSPTTAFKVKHEFIVIINSKKMIYKRVLEKAKGHVNFAYFEHLFHIPQHPKDALPTA